MILSPVYLLVNQYLILFKCTLNSFEFLWFVKLRDVVVSKLRNSVAQLFTQIIYCFKHILLNIVIFNFQLFLLLLKGYQLSPQLFDFKLKLFVSEDIGIFIASLRLWCALNWSWIGCFLLKISHEFSGKLLVLLKLIYLSINLYEFNFIIIIVNFCVF